MDYTPRTTPHLRHTAQGLVLLASRSAPEAPAQFPPAAGALAGQTLQEVPLGPEGTLYSFTTVYPGGGKPPLWLAMVDFAPGLRVFGPLLDPQRPVVFGATVRVVPWALPDGSADYAFEVV